MTTLTRHLPPMLPTGGGCGTPAAQAAPISSATVPDIGQVDYHTPEP